MHGKHQKIAFLFFIYSNLLIQRVDEFVIFFVLLSTNVLLLKKFSKSFRIKTLRPIVSTCCQNYYIFGANYISFCFYYWMKHMAAFDLNNKMFVAASLQ